MSARAERRKKRKEQFARSDIPTNEGCFGYCSQCDEFHTLDTQLARPYAIELMQLLDFHQRIDFTIPLEKANEVFKLDFIYQHMGQMFGVLLCEKSNGEKVVLKAFSARHQYVWNCLGWVPPLVNPEEYIALEKKGDELIKPLTEQIENTLRETPLWHELRKKRKMTSHQVMYDFYQLYELQNFKGERAGLEQVFVPNSSPQIPMGTGDCCAPKLLCEAARQGLRPLSIAEFYWGKGTLDGARIQGQFYPSCEKRCQPILGFLLCGIKK